MNDEPLATTLEAFARIRSSKRFTRSDVLKVLDQADEVIQVLLVNTIEAEGFNDMLQGQVDRVAAANRKLAQVAASVTGPVRHGTA